MFSFSEFEGEEHGDASSDPEVLLLVTWQLQIDDEVGRVTSCHQRACARQHLVKWRSVYATLWHLAVFDWNEV